MGQLIYDPRNANPWGEKQNPDDLIDASSGADAKTRLAMSVATSPEAKMNALASKYGKGNVGVIDDPSSKYHGQLVFRGSDGKPVLADESTLSLKDIVDETGSVLDFGLSGAGGIVGQVLSPIVPGVGAVVGAGAGGALSEAVKQGIASGMDVNDLSLADAVARQAGGFAEGATQEMGGKMLEKGVEKALNPLMGKMTRDAMDKAAFARSKGFELTPGELTQNKNMMLLDTALSSTIPSAGMYQAHYAKNLKALGNLAEETIDSAGGRIAPLKAGEMAQEGFRDTVNIFKKKAAELYDSVDKAADGGAVVVPKELMKMVDSIKSKSNYWDTLSPEVKSLLTKIEKISVDDNGELIAHPFSQIRNLRSELGRLGDSQDAISQGNQGFFKLLRSSLEKDIDEFGRKQGGEVQQALEAANKFYREGDEISPSVAMIKSKLGKKLNKTDTPEDIIDSVFNSGDASTILQARQLTGKDGFQALKQAWLTDFIDKATQTATTKNHETVSFPSKAAIDRFVKSNRNTLDVIFSKDELQRLYDLRDMAELTASSQRIAGNTSGTAQVSATQRAIDKAGMALAGGGAAVLGGGAGAYGSGGDATDIMAGAAGGLGVAYLLAKGTLSPTVFNTLMKKRTLSPAAKIPITAAGQYAGRNLSEWSGGE